VFNQSGATCKILVGCDDADTSATPTTWANLSGKTMTTARVTNNNVAAWTAGTEYTFDVTTAVQEVLDRAGFSAGNVVGIVIYDNGSSANALRSIASYEHATYTEPILVIDSGGGQYIGWTD
jgi:hypothetical protein